MISRVEAAARRLSQCIVSGTHDRDPDTPRPGGSGAVWQNMERAAVECLAAADAVDPLRLPVAELRGKVPLVLMFATKADADEFAAVVAEVFANPVEVVL